MEGAALAGVPEPDDAAGIESVARKLRERGVQTVYITAGQRGVHFASPDDSGWLPAGCVEVANTTGAGDAFSAGVAWGILHRWPVRRCAVAGSVLSAIALASDRTVSDKVSAQLILAAMEEMPS